MGICDHWSTNPPGLLFEPLKLLNFPLIADPGPGVHSNANAYPNPASENGTDPDPQPSTYQCGSTQTCMGSVIVGLLQDWEQLMLSLEESQFRSA